MRVRRGGIGLQRSRRSLIRSWPRQWGLEVRITNKCLVCSSADVVVVSSAIRLRQHARRPRSESSPTRPRPIPGPSPSPSTSQQAQNPRVSGQPRIHCVSTTGTVSSSKVVRGCVVCEVRVLAAVVDLELTSSSSRQRDGASLSHIVHVLLSP